MRAVLTFHSVDHLSGPLSYPPAALEALLSALAQADIPVLSLDELLEDKQSHGVSITFDDGLSSVFATAMPILRAHNAPAHVFAITGWVGRDNRWPGQPAGAPALKLMEWTELEEVQKAGCLIEAHTATHPDLRTLSNSQIADEFDEANSVIEGRLGRRPRYLAYPYGYHDARVRAIAARAYRGCFTTRLDYLHAAVSLNAIPRLDAHYLRSTRLVRNLDGQGARAYIALRRALRRLRGH